MTTPQGQNGSWAAAGPAGDDIAYRTQNLKFTGVELSLDESVPFSVLFRLWCYAAAVSWAIFIVFAFFGLIDAISSSSSDSTSPFATDNGNGGVPGGGFFVAGSIISFIVFWVILLAVKVQEPVAEWKTLLEGKAQAAESSYAAIFHSLARRRIPIGVSASRVRSDVLSAESVNNRLLLTERSYIAYVSVFEFGTSLYVGWMMWRTRRGATLIGHFLKDIIGGIFGRTGIVNQMLRTERVRAMREAVHSAVREGVDAAVEGISMPIATTFGYEIPIQSAVATAPNPGPPQPLAAGQSAGPVV